MHTCHEVGALAYSFSISIRTSRVSNKNACTVAPIIHSIALSASYSVKKISSWNEIHTNTGDIQLCVTAALILKAHLILNHMLLSTTLCAHVNDRRVCVRQGMINETKIVRSNSHSASADTTHAHARMLKQALGRIEYYHVSILRRSSFRYAP